MDVRVAMFVKEIRVYLNGGSSYISLNEIEVFTDDASYQDR